jgi:hypothetical protein
MAPVPVMSAEDFRLRVEGKITADEYVRRLNVQAFERATREDREAMAREPCRPCHYHRSMTNQKLTTDGISPKMYVPAAAQVVLGIVLILLGLDVEGRTVIATGLGTAVVGFGASPGAVQAKATDG